MQVGDSLRGVIGFDELLDEAFGGLFGIHLGFEGGEEGHPEVGLLGEVGTHGGTPPLEAWGERAEEGERVGKVGTRFGDDGEVVHEVVDSVDFFAVLGQVSTMLGWLFSFVFGVCLPTPVSASHTCSS